MKHCTHVDVKLSQREPWNQEKYTVFFKKKSDSIIFPTVTHILRQSLVQRRTLCVCLSDRKRETESTHEMKNPNNNAVVVTWLLWLVAGLSLQRPMHVGIVADQVATVQALLRILRSYHCQNHFNTRASTIGAIIFKLIIPSFQKLKKMDSRFVTSISCYICTEELSRIRRIEHSYICVLILKAV